MNSFQLDECMDCKRLVRACTNQGLAKVIRFPASLKTKDARKERKQKDQTILPYFLMREPPFVTSDKPIIEDNLLFIPPVHCGVIIISNAKPSPETTFVDMQAILEKFKTRFPQWHAVNWRNSIVEITQEWITIKKIAGTGVASTFLSFDDLSWQTKLNEHLAMESTRDLIR
jgi:hypothetical protein